MIPTPTRATRTALAGALATAGILAASPAGAGGLLLYEVGTADVGLASAGYTARAQDASTVFTNPAGMTRLDGNQVTLGAQVLYGDYGFSIGQGTSPELGGADGGLPIGWFPGGGFFYSYSASPDLKLGFAATGNFGLALKYDSDWAGRYYVQEGTLIGLSLLPSIAYRVSPQLSLGVSLNAMYGKLKNQVAVNNLVGADGQLVLNSHKWGYGANVGIL
jgi:long-chain fatty acid transport protein